MYVLDTNTLIYFFKGMGNVAQCLLAQSPQDIAIPAIVLYELQVGVAKSNQPRKRQRQLETLLTQTAVLSFGEKEVQHAAQTRAYLEKQGTPIGAYDVLIAGTALAQRATLVTHNTVEFSRVPKLVLEDWF